ncbi:MAG: DNA polymerase IV [Gammaproteobacteria bacterium]
MTHLRKIIHIDMDCFYAAIEMRDNPALINKPVAVGATAEQRGVLCTCNYIARKYGIHSAMPTALALKKCPDLVLLPVNMGKYKAVAKQIHQIFLEYTPLVEPLAFDEAYLDVTNSNDFQGSATWIAQAIRKQIWDTLQLTASAGVAPNKYLAKIASGWNKPNGIMVIPPQKVENFVTALPVTKLFGVGKVMTQKLHAIGLKTCQDLQKLTESELSATFGKLGRRLYEQCRGIDNRPVEPNRVRKSLSVERTFPQDAHDLQECLSVVSSLYHQLLHRLEESASTHPIKNQFLKIKFNNFKITTAEMMVSEINLQVYINLLHRIHEKENRPIRLMGLGVHFSV